MTLDASAYILMLSGACAASWAALKIPKNGRSSDTAPWRSALGFFPQFFWPLFLVAALRVGVAEPFRIPSGSMNPLLVSGDFILVNKFAWGIKFPFTQASATGGSAPARGSVAVFRYPPDPSIDFIKRLVGAPGDLVEYKGKKLWINGVAASYQDFDPAAGSATEQLPGEAGGHRILFNRERQTEFPLANMPGCQNGGEIDSFSCTVPPGHYLAMGDNRDNSLDGRYWGFVPQANLIGGAFFLWMSLDSLTRIGPIQ